MNQLINDGIIVPNRGNVYVDVNDLWNAIQNLRQSQQQISQSSQSSSNRGINKKSNIIGKYNKETGVIDKFYVEFRDNNENDDEENDVNMRDLELDSDNIDTENNKVIIEGLEGITGMIIDFDKVKSETINIDKDVLYEDEGIVTCDKLTACPKAIEHVDVSDVVLNISRDIDGNNEVVVDYTVNKNVNRSRGLKSRRDLLGDDGIINSEDNELINSVKVNLDLNKLDIGVTENTLIKKINIIGKINEEIDVKGVGKLRYCDNDHLYKIKGNGEDDVIIIFINLNNLNEVILCYK